MRVRSLSLIAFAAVLSIAALASCGKQSTPSATENASYDQPLNVAHIDLGRAVDTDKQVTDKASSFKPNETIYATVNTTGSARTAELRARWTYEDGQVVDETPQMISPQGNAATEFHISKPDGFPPGKYKLEVFLNGNSVGTKDFEVKGT